MQDKTLDQLYNLLKSQSVDALVVPDIPKEELDATKSFAVSLQVSVSYLRERNPEAVNYLRYWVCFLQGLYLLDLDAIWGEGWRPLMDALVRASLVERDEIGRE